MGAINYGSNDYINIGINPDNYWIENENGENEFLDFDIESDYVEVHGILDKYDFEYFAVDVKMGYYEGFYIDIDFDYLWVDSYEKPLILKELTQLKKFLLQCCEYGMVKYSPGWCTGYSDYKTTQKAINQAIGDAKEKIRKYPTWKTYKRVTN